MKFQLKALAAAMVLAAAVPAQAAMQEGGSGNSSLTVAVYDSSTGYGGLFDLGKSYSDFNKVGTSFANSNVDAVGTNFSWDLTTGDYAAAWNGLLASVNPANLFFTVIAVDTIGTGAGNRGLISTLNTDSVETITGPNLSTLTNNWNSYLIEAQVTAPIFQNHSVVENGASYGNQGLGTTAQYFLNNKPNGRGNISGGLIGSTLDVYQVVSGASNIAASTYSIFGNGAAFTLAANGLLTYTTNDPVVVVPEADTWAMMLLGLGFMGFAARRKQA
ncbi:MAG: PEP-CTERM sorting domain-containing protein [Methylophilus sp.]|nr:PEP-CTERM sorting domain-containing protein [Methylophilus sp.]